MKNKQINRAEAQRTETKTQAAEQYRSPTYPATCLLRAMTHAPGTVSGRPQASESAGPCLPGLDLVRFLTISGHAIQLSGYAVTSLEGPNRYQVPRQIPNSGSVTSPKMVLFSSVFSRPKKSEKRSPRPQKNDKHRLRTL